MGRDVPSNIATPIADAAGYVIEENLVKPAVRKVKRKASRYNIEYKKQYAKLRKKHPRTKFSTLVKRAHRNTKAALK